MAIVRPFRGFRPRPDLAARVAAPPYDVLNTEEARAAARGNPYSFLHVSKPEIDLPPGTDLCDERVYRQARTNLDRLLDDGILLEDPVPALYLYGLTMGDHTQIGIVGCVSVEEYWNDTIKKHELTRKEKEDDRTKHVEVTDAHTGPVFLTYRAQPAIDHLVEGLRETPPVNDFVAVDGIRHRLWVIANPSLTESLRDAFRPVPTLYVADGHHRSAAAARVGRERARANANHTGSEEYNFFLAVLFPHNQLRILAYNRLVRDLQGWNLAALLERFTADFEVRAAAGPVRPSQKGEYGMYCHGGWYVLSARPSLVTSADPVERLDVSILQKRLLAPFFGIDDPRTSRQLDFVGGIRGVKELERRVNSGEMAAAFSLYPTSVEELLSIADAGKILPPKSTWFEPKLRDGLVVHFLSETRIPPFSPAEG